VISEEKKGIHLVPINISTRHGHISDETQAKIKEKLEKLPRYYDRITGMELTINLEHRDTPQLDLRVSAKDKHDFIATETGELLASIDVLVEKLENQVRKHKEKVQDRHRVIGHRFEEPVVEGEASAEEDE
jgi:putative sigma-54 modulation protein